MTDAHDVLIIGAGHNGLICAAYLAKAGRKVLVLERSDQPGGAAVTAEFVPGFRVSACAHILHMLQPKIIRDLNLKAHLLEVGGPSIDTIALAGDGNHLTISRHKIEGAGVSEADKAAYTAFIKRLERHAKALAPQLLKTPPRLANAGLGNAMQLAGMGWAIRFGLGKRRMRDFLRIVGMNIHGLLDEVFESEALKGALAFDAVLGSAMEPRMPSTVLTYLYRLAGGLESDLTLPKGGMGSVTAALADAAKGYGAELRTSAAVERILLEGGEAVGVVLTGGEELRAPIVISNADPKTTFLKLVGARNLEAGFAHRISHLRSSGRAAKLHMALNALPEFTGLEPEALGNRLVIAPSRKYLELAFNHSKYGEYSERPAMEITIPSIADPSLAPAGKHVLSAIVQYAPYEVKGGWEAGKDAFIERAVDVISDYAPNFRDIMTVVECLTPVDIERRFGMTGGHWHHGELAIDQMFMMRPTYGAAQYQTPIDGLYLCGAGAHPGGGVMGAAGHNAAQAVLAGEK
ncbi:MAG: NAD(P)/FAD-dependent oxidoreductase [Sphingomonadales bacterium]